MASFWEQFSQAAPAQPTPVIVQPAPAPEPTETKPDPTKASPDWFKAADTDAKPVEFQLPALTGKPEEMEAAIAKLNFVGQAATPELLEKIKGGGDEATQALLLAMNSVAQNTMRASLQTSEAMVKAAMASAKPMIASEIESSARGKLVTDSIKAASPVFANEAAAPIVQSLAGVFAAKFPDATSEQIKDMALSYATDVLMYREDPAAKEAAEQKATASNWDAFLQDM